MSKIKVNEIENRNGDTLTLGKCGTTVQLAAGAISGIPGGVDWDTTIKTADFNATAGKGFFVDTTSNVITVTLPTGVAGESVTVLDYIANANTNAIIFSPQSGEKIEGGTVGQGVTANRQATTLTYSGATQGWLVSSSGDSGPITEPTITFTTASGTLGTLTDLQRSDPDGNLSSAGATASFGTLSFSIQSGSLPSGVTLNSTTAALEGTADAVASETTSNFTIRATISETGTTSDRAFSITVETPTITFTTASGSLGTLQTVAEKSDPNANLSVVTASTSSGTLSYAIQSGSLPASLTLNSSTGAFVGTVDEPVSDFTSNFTVRATNTSGFTLDRSFSIQVNQNQLFVAASGGSESISGDYKIHTFTGPGTLTVSCAGNDAGSNEVSYLIVAGGGGGCGFGLSGAGGGGGGGGFREGSDGSYTDSPLATTALPVSVQGYPITVGGGGSGGSKPSAGSPQGGNSVFASIVSTGGGRGGGHPNSGGTDGEPGGSGGGGTGPGGPPGAGNTPAVSPPQGNPGGPGGGSNNGGGGGGATGGGGVSGGGTGGTTQINGSSITKSTGGNGWTSTTGPKPPAPANSGDGGEGARGDNAVAGSGGSGIVIIRYKFQ